MLIVGKNVTKYAKNIFLGAVGLCFFAGGPAFASSQIFDDSHVFVPERTIVAQSFEERREQSRREFEERREQNRRDFEERSRTMQKQFDAQVKRNQEQFDQRVKENNERFDKFMMMAIAFGAVSLVVKLLGIYVASKRK